MPIPTLRQIDNDLYDRLADTWWRENGFLNLLQTTLNPWRLPYFKRILGQLQIDPDGSRALDVGCGGGLLTEEIAAMGFCVTGIDPSVRSLEIARAHAAQESLRIEYRVGYGHDLPFENESFDVVFCCDVLEHVTEWDAVIRDIARVLRGGGVIMYDTINRTFASKLRSIFIAQEWKWTRYAPPDTHVWEMFITPDEIAESFERHGLAQKDITGTAAKGNPFQALRLVRQYSRGKISSVDFGRGIDMTEGPILSGSYMGYAVKS
jgi:2-polyprenyl-6-hydroxyphenyl methylase / 3-demethylubiquinone-9 3-methyltransferase